MIAPAKRISLWIRIHEIIAGNETATVLSSAPSVLDASLPPGRAQIHRAFSGQGFEMIPLAIVVFPHYGMRAR